MSDNTYCQFCERPILVPILINDEPAHLNCAYDELIVEPPVEQDRLLYAVDLSTGEVGMVENPSVPPIESDSLDLPAIARELGMGEQKFEYCSTQDCPGTCEPLCVPHTPCEACEYSERGAFGGPEHTCINVDDSEEVETITDGTGTFRLGSLELVKT